MKKVAIVASLITITLYLSIVVSAFFFAHDNNLKPGKNYITDYVSPTSRYAVKVLYNEQKQPQDILVIDAKSGNMRTGVSMPSGTVSYKINEVKPIMSFVMYDIDGKELETNKFDTQKGEWVN